MASEHWRTGNVPTRVSVKKYDGPPRPSTVRGRLSTGSNARRTETGQLLVSARCVRLKTSRGIITFARAGITTIVIGAVLGPRVAIAVVAGCIGIEGRHSCRCPTSASPTAPTTAVIIWWWAPIGIRSRIRTVGKSLFTIGTNGLVSPSLDNMRVLCRATRLNRASHVPNAALSSVGVREQHCRFFGCELSDPQTRLRIVREVGRGSQPIVGNGWSSETRQTNEHQGRYRWNKTHGECL